MLIPILTYNQQVFHLVSFIYIGSGIVTPTPSGSCLALNLNYSGCCVWSLSPTCWNYGCYCDQICHTAGDCCSDVADIGCHPISIGMTNRKILLFKAHINYLQSKL